MYTREQLCRYPYFEKVLKDKPVSGILDPLTGLVARPYIIGFAKSLIEQEIPFTFGMVDLDNFKYVNDTYGHTAGDGILQGVGEALMKFTDGYAVIGRFGGDEFLFVNIRDLSYEAKKGFCGGLYWNFNVLRRTYKVEGFELFVTGTSGLASYPEDADTYAKLFAAIDKTLYRGKTKGRNCYIIYVAEKHEGIEILNMKKPAQYEVMKQIAAACEKTEGLMQKLIAVGDCFVSCFHISDMYYAKEDHVFFSISRNAPIGCADDASVLCGTDIFASNTLQEDIQEKAPQFYAMLADNDFETVMIAPLIAGNRNLGYLMWAEPHNRRIWQDSEMSAMFFAGKLLESDFVSSAA